MHCLFCGRPTGPYPYCDADCESDHALFADDYPQASETSAVDDFYSDLLDAHEDMNALAAYDIQDDF